MRIQNAIMASKRTAWAPWMSFRICFFDRCEIDDVGAKMSLIHVPVSGIVEGWLYRSNLFSDEKRIALMPRSAAFRQVPGQVWKAGLNLRDGLCPSHVYDAMIRQ